MVLVNGDSNGLCSDCSTESSTEPDGSLLQHRDNMCLDAIYNLYAISVSQALWDAGIRAGRTVRQVLNVVLLHLSSAIQEYWEEATM